MTKAARDQKIIDAYKNAAQNAALFVGAGIAGAVMSATYLSYKQDYGLVKSGLIGLASATVCNIVLAFPMVYGANKCGEWLGNRVVDTIVVILNYQGINDSTSTVELSGLSPADSSLAIDLAA